MLKKEPQLLAKPKLDQVLQKTILLEYYKGFRDIHRLANKFEVSPEAVISLIFYDSSALAQQARIEARPRRQSGFTKFNDSILYQCYWKIVDKDRGPKIRLSQV